MSNLSRLQHRLRAMGYHGVIVPSTDEYLSEFAPPSARRLQWVTEFSGSMGLAAVLQERAAIFLDGRYKLQGQRDTAALDIELLDSGDANICNWLAATLRADDQLAIDTRLQPYSDIERLLAFAAEHRIRIVELAESLIDELWGPERPKASSSLIIDYPVHFAGTPAEAKCRRLEESLAAAGLDCYLLTDPEDVAWLLNVRTNEELVEPLPDGSHIIPVPLSRVLIEKTGNAFWFVETSLLEPVLSARLKDAVTIVDPEKFEPFLTSRVTGKKVGANLRRTPYRFAAIVQRVGSIRNSPLVAQWRWRKHSNEIARAREGHYLDGMAVIRFLAWVQRSVRERRVTETEASRKLTEFRKELSGYKGISMPIMSASGASGAMAHYVPSEHSDRDLNDHPIYWVDSGAQYFGCSTDNTACLAVGMPEPRHIHAHTLVVKGYIALALARFPAGIASTQIDSFARQYLWQEGMDYRHGTGHGVGNFMNIHEGPYIRKEIDHPLVAPMEEGMIVANEPAYYADNDFGIRIESHMVTVKSKFEGFLEFEMLSRLPIDPKLMDESLLTRNEIRWLAHYHRTIADGYNGCFDEETAQWFRDIVDSYEQMI